MIPPALSSRQRDLRVLRNPMVRRAPDGSIRQLGVVYDARGHRGRYGYSATVFLTNLFLRPRAEAVFFTLPRCVYDTIEELLDDGWTVD